MNTATEGVEEYNDITDSLNSENRHRQRVIPSDGPHKRYPDLRKKKII